MIKLTIFLFVCCLVECVHAKDEKQAEAAKQQQQEMPLIPLNDTESKKTKRSMEEIRTEDTDILMGFWRKPSAAYVNVTDPYKMVIELSPQAYNDLVVGQSSGHLLTDMPWFISFIQPQSQYCQMMKPNLEQLAYHYNGTVQFAYINANDEDAENLRISYWAYDVPRSYFIDPVTKSAYAFELILPYITPTLEWIDEKKYLKSPLKFTPVPHTVSDMPGLQIEYIRRDVRKWWDDYCREFVEKYIFLGEELTIKYSPIEPPLMKQVVNLIVDRNSTDWSSVKLHVKPDRQIACFFAFLIWFTGFWFFLATKLIVRMIVILIEKQEKKQEELKAKIQSKIDEAKKDGKEVKPGDKGEKKTKQEKDNKREKID